MVAMLALESGRTIFAKIRNIVRTVQSCGLLKALRNCGEEASHNDYVVCTDESRQNQRPAVVDQMHVFDQQVSRDHTAGKQHGEQDQKVQCFLERQVCLGKRIAVVAVNRVPNTVPSTVTPIVVAYPVQMDGSLNTFA